MKSECVHGELGGSQFVHVLYIVYIYEYSLVSEHVKAIQVVEASHDLEK
jgi:hypothetical protein